MIHRMDPAPEDWEELPELIRPMLCQAGDLPADAGGWSLRVQVGRCAGGRLRRRRPGHDLLSRNDLDITSAYPELHALGRGPRIATGRPRRGDRRVRRGQPPELRPPAAAHARPRPGRPPADCRRRSRSAISSSTSSTSTDAPPSACPTPSAAACSSRWRWPATTGRHPAATGSAPSAVMRGRPVGGSRGRRVQAGRQRLCAGAPVGRLGQDPRPCSPRRWWWAGSPRDRAAGPGRSARSSSGSPTTGASATRARSARGSPTPT